MSFAAIITAAGASSRMGRPKALVRWPADHGEPLLLHQVEVLRSLPVGDIVVVLGHDAGTIRRELATWPAAATVRVVDNPRWEAGRSTSIEAAAAALGPGFMAVFVVAVDQPLTPGVVKILADSWTDKDLVIQPSRDGRRGHPVLVSAALVPELAHATAYPEGLRDIVRQAGARAVEVTEAAIHLDLNTPADLTRRS